MVSLIERRIHDVRFHYVMSFTIIPIILSLLRIFARRENQLSELFLSPIIVARNNNRITVSKITKMKRLRRIMKYCLSSYMLVRILANAQQKIYTFFEQYVYRFSLF